MPTANSAGAMVIRVEAASYRGEERALRAFLMHGFALKGGQFSPDGTSWSATIAGRDGGNDGYTITVARDGGAL